MPIPPSTALPATGTTVDISDTTGHKIAVTLVRVVDPDTADAGASGACSPDHLVAVELSVTNLGTSILITTAADQGVILSDANSAPWRNHSVFGCGIGSSTDATSSCATVSNALDLSPGATGIACPAINVPANDSIAQVQFDSAQVFPSVFATGRNTANWQIG